MDSSFQINSLTERVKELEQQVETYRQREHEQLLARLATAEEAAEHYKAEAHRLNAVAIELKNEFEKQLHEVRTKLAAYESTATGQTRVGLVNASRS